MNTFNKALGVAFGSLVLGQGLYAQQCDFSTCDTTSKVRSTLNDFLVQDAGKIATFNDGIQAIKGAKTKIETIMATAPVQGNFLVKWAKKLLNTATEWWSRFICQKACSGWLDLVVVRETKAAFKLDNTLNIDQHITNTYKNILGQQDLSDAQKALLGKEDTLSKYIDDSAQIDAFKASMEIVADKKKQQKEDTDESSAVKAVATEARQQKGLLSGLMARFGLAWNTTDQTLDEADLV